MKFTIISAPTVTDYGPFSDPERLGPVLGPIMDYIINEIKLMPSESIKSISGTVKTKEKAIKANKIVFDDLGELIFENLRQDYLAIVTKELVFSAPQYRARIRRNPNAKAENGANAAPETRKPPQPEKAANGKGGTGGTSGYEGFTGESGETHNMPPLLIFAGKITREEGGTADFIELRIFVEGVDGGHGGRGGQGGPGGDGGGGGDGVSMGAHCDSGPGDGGRGGPAGRGGRGGNGGNGGDGGTVLYFGPKDVTDELALSRVRNIGGIVGKGGNPGVHGQIGEPGSRGSRTGWCQGGKDGAYGEVPFPTDRGVGDDGKFEGQTGTVAWCEFDDFSLLF